METQGHKQNINREMEELKMVSAKLALRSAKHLSDVHQREKDNMQEAIEKAMEARKHLLWQMELLAIVAFFAIVIMIWFIWRDARKERIYRENLEAANEEIQRIMNQRERLLLTITHDIKAPAASISGFIDLMKAYVSNPQGIECLQNIKNSATHLSHLVASLLDYHQLENGLMKVQPTSFSPAQLVAESVEGMKLRAEEKGLAISFECKTKGMEFFRADAFRIRQILDNLVSNAIKYTDRGSVTIQAQVSEILGKPTLTLSVKDTGKGMTDEEKQKVFQAFTRLKSAQGIEGTGLGLATLQELDTPTDIGMKKIPFYTDSISFNATLPFNHKRILAEATDLRTIPDLEEKVLAHYNMVRQMMIDGNYYEYNKMRLASTWVLTEMNYLGKEALEKTYIASDDFFRFFCNPIDWIAEPIQNYEMVVCGNGKLVYLRRKLELDNILRVRFYDTEEEKRLSPEERTVTASMFILLYMPKGSDELVELY